jgi:hypothetical protein
MTNNYFCDRVAIVLTGTIIPNVTNQLQHLDPDIRRSEYLEAINFYNKFAFVYFLENSSYPLLEDNEFKNLPNTVIKKYPLSNFPEKGRGFQEFEMIDAWMTSELNAPAKWLKITGRYIYQNIQEILDECCDNLTTDILVNQYKFSGYADPAILCVSSAFYQKNVLGLYRECDDQTGWFIEKALHKRLQSIDAGTCQRFKHSLVCTGIAGFSGQKMRRDWRDQINQNVAIISYILDNKYLWLKM